MPRFNLASSTPLTTFYLDYVITYLVENKRMGKVEKDDDYNDRLFKIAKWLCEEEQRFGLLLMGNVGNGKTTIMKAIQELILHRDLKRKEDKEIFMRVEGAKDIMRIYKSPISYDRLCDAPILGIDDLGEEATELVDYGNVITPITDILEYRYQKRLMTIITTNLDPIELTKKYGTRVADRFREMMTKIIFTNPSYRK